MAPPPQARRAFVVRYLVALVSAFAVLVTGIVAVNVAVNQKIAGIDRVEGLRLPESKGKAGNYLLLGSDTRSFVTTEEQKAAFGSQSDIGGNRSDTLMVIHVDPDQKKSLLVSIPRDTWVNVPGRGMAKINSAFNDGPQKVIDTLKQNFDIDVNHYLELDFESFKGVVNAIGKVPVYFPAPARDHYTGLNITQGPACVRLDGDTALAYVRSRTLEYYDASSRRWRLADAIPDIGRIGRQQAFIRRLAEVAAAKAGHNPFAANRMANAIVPKLQVDAQLSRSDILGLVNTFRTVNPSDTSSIEMLTLPTKGGPRQSGQDVLYLQQPDADQVLARLRQFGAAPTTTSDLLPSQVRVRVLNGSGVGGLAQDTLAQLQQYSFAPAGLGNAAKVKATEIRYRPKHLEDAQLVQSYLGGHGKLLEDASVVDADVVIVLGPDFTGVTAPAGATTTTAKRGTTPTTVKPSTPTTAPAGTPATAVSPIEANC